MIDEHLFNLRRPVFFVGRKPRRAQTMLARRGAWMKDWRLIDACGFPRGTSLLAVGPVRAVGSWVAEA